MDYLGLLFELIFLAIGLYMYLFAIGKIRSKNPDMQKKADEFRQKNKTWMRLLGLALTAIMVVNIILHLMQWE